MQTIHDLTRNYTLLCGVLGWISAQVIKTLLTLIVTRRFEWERLFGAGGMPSSHSAMVVALFVSTARAGGVSSPEFSVTFVLACIVMYDAMGVRRQAGRHAQMLNQLTGLLKIDEDGDEDDGDSKNLKEKIGHTPLEVLGGALLGILIAVLIPVR